eukprot:gene13115-17579_t
MSYNSFENDGDTTIDEIESSNNLLSSNSHNRKINSNKNYNSNSLFKATYVHYILVTTIFICVLLISYNYSSSTYTNSKSTSSSASSSIKKDLNTGENSKPNFVFLLIDDLGWNSMNYNSVDFKNVAPNLHNLAKRGIIMENYYSQEVCAPARASLLTGKYPFSIGLQYGELQPESASGLSLEHELISGLLADNNYINYMVGKWNLGHYTPEYLPTARGFHRYLGFLGPSFYQWTKRSTTESKFWDFMISNGECYQFYNDTKTYATHLFTNDINGVIRNHDFDSNPMFLYYSSQAVHDPFDDDGYDSGIPDDYITSQVLEIINNDIIGNRRQEVAKTLSILDDSINSIIMALKEKDQFDNTYFIVASDNGGCKYEGGRNSPFRGNKGTLFEGGTKVAAFLYSSALEKSYGGTSYSGLMHVSDWYPTILDIAGISYLADTLDGVTQKDAMLNIIENKRKSLVYNMYTNVVISGETFDIYTNASVAIRDEQFKLMHVFTGNSLDSYDNISVALSQDDDFNEGSCTQDSSLSGTFEYLLFDLKNDPYETINLYNMSEYITHQNKLEDLITFYRERAVVNEAGSPDASAESLWKLNDYYVQPWVDGDVPSVRPYP